MPAVMAHGVGVGHGAMACLKSAVRVRHSDAEVLLHAAACARITFRNVATVRVGHGALLCARAGLPACAKPFANVRSDRQSVCLRGNWRGAAEHQHVCVCSIEHEKPQAPIHTLSPHTRHTTPVLVRTASRGAACICVPSSPPAASCKYWAGAASVPTARQVGGLRQGRGGRRRVGAPA